MMINNNLRQELRHQFVQQYFSAQDLASNYVMKPMAGDASLRSYYRILRENESWILMDCPVDYQPLTSFINVEQLLRNNGFRTPKTLQADHENGFLLLEDLGAISIKNYLDLHKDNKQKHKLIYEKIIDILADLHKKPISGDFLLFDNERLHEELELFQWYVEYVSGRHMSDTEYNDFSAIWQNILVKQKSMGHVLVLRDYHVENMMYLGDHKNGKPIIALLDFQDALLGSPIYDLVSVLEDARYDVARPDALELIDYFCDKSGLAQDDVLLNYHILGAQRNLRILGVFARKLLRDKSDNYLQYMPRVKGYLANDLSHPELGDLAIFLEKFL